MCLCAVQLSNKQIACGSQFTCCTCVRECRPQFESTRAAHDASLRSDCRHCRVVLVIACYLLHSSFVRFEFVSLRLLLILGNKCHLVFGRSGAVCGQFVYLFVKIQTENNNELGAVWVCECVCVCECCAPNLTNFEPTFFSQTHTRGSSGEFVRSFVRLLSVSLEKNKRCSLVGAADARAASG